MCKKALQELMLAGPLKYEAKDPQRGARLCLQAYLHFSVNLSLL